MLSDQDAFNDEDESVGDLYERSDDINVEERGAMDSRLYWSFFVLGAGSLCPWISLIQAADYFGYVHPGIEYSIGTDYMIGNLALFMLGILFGEGVPARQRAIAGYGLMLACMLVLPVGVALSDGAAWLILLVAALLGALEAVVGSTLMSMAGMLWPECVHAWVNGQGAIGVLIAGLRVATKLAFDDTVQGLQISSYVYLAVAAALSLLSLLCWFYCERLPAVAHVLRRQHDASPQQRYHRGTLDDDSNNKWSFFVAECRRIARLWRGVAVPSALVALVFTVTLAVVPGLITQVPSQHQLGGWLPVVLIALFNLFDWLGRLLPNWPPVARLLTLRRVTWLTAARLVFVPLFALAAAALLPPVSLLDFYAVVLSILLALSNGCMATVVMMQGLHWSNVADADAQTSMTLITFSLILGLTFGSFIGLFISKFI